MENTVTKAQRRGIIITLMVGTLMAALDTSIVNVSIPAMMHDFHTTISEIELVVSSYMIGFVLIMPLTHWLKDHLGYYRLYLTCLTVFLLGSLLCGLAPTLPILVAARVIQALGGGAITPTAMAILATVFDSKERGKVLGMWGLGVVVGPAFGPTLGGLLTERFGWPSIFLINIPIGLIGMYLTTTYLKPLSHEHKRITNPFDWSGFLLFAVFVISFFYFIGNLQSVESLSTPQSMGNLMLVVASLFSLIFVESTKTHRLINIDLFKNSTFVSCISVTLFRSIALFGGMFLLPLYLQFIANYSETQAGMILFPGTACVAIFMPFAGKWADRYGARPISLIGLILLTSSMFLFSTMDFTTGLYSILGFMSLRGLALGLLVTPITVATMNAVSSDQFASASSLNSIMQQLGGAVGVSLLAFIQHAEKNQQIINGLSELQAEQKGISYAFSVAFVIVLISLIPCLNIREKRVS